MSEKKISRDEFVETFVKSTSPGANFRPKVDPRETVKYQESVIKKEDDKIKNIHGQFNWMEENTQTLTMDNLRVDLKDLLNRYEVKINSKVASYLISLEEAISKQLD